MAARKAKLSVVKPGDPTPEPDKVLTLAEAVETGDLRKILVAQRREIAQSIPDEKGPAKAALHRQLLLIAKELEVMDRRAKEEADEDGVTPDEEWDAEAL